MARVKAGNSFLFFINLRRRHFVWLVFCEFQTAAFNRDGSFRIIYGNMCPYAAVRVKGGKSLRNGMWNGVRNGIIMRNTIYAGNKLTEERVMFSRQFYKSSSFFDAADSC